MKPIASALILTAIASIWMPAISDTEKNQSSKKSSLANPYEDGVDKAAVNIVNASLGSVGKVVVITVKPSNGKKQRFYAKIPGDKYSPEGDETAKALLATTSALNAAIEQAKRHNSSSAISISIELMPASGGTLIKRKADLMQVIQEKAERLKDPGYVKEMREKYQPTK